MREARLKTLSNKKVCQNIFKHKLVDVLFEQEALLLQKDLAIRLSVKILQPFLDTTTFEVNVTACDLKNSFIFDNDAEIISHVCFVIYM